VVEDLRAGAAALAHRDFDAASAAYRRAFEAAATVEERRQALDGFVELAVDSHRADLAAYLDQRRAAAPDDQRPLLLAAAARCQKASDGHFSGALARLQAETDKRDKPEAFRLARELRDALTTVDTYLARAGREMRAAALEPVKRPVLPLRARLRSDVRPIVLAAPDVPKLAALGLLAVTKPAPTHAHGQKLAPLFFSHFYQKATELAAQGFFESAKAEYATIIQLFPETPQAEQAARLAIQLFKRERGVNQGPDALVAYLQWVQAVLGPKGSDYAEYMAFKGLAHGADPTIIAREAEGFLQRHADSKWVPSMRIQYALALDSLGASARAIDVLKPMTQTLDDRLSAKAAQILAWLYLFQGDGPSAKPVLQALAAQTVATEEAKAAQKLLEQMAARPLEKIPLPPAEAPEEPDEAYATSLLRLAAALLAKGDAERAMDLYALYLHSCTDTPGFWAARQRIERLKQTGKVEEP